MLNRRLLNAYLILFAGILLFVVRRFVLPTSFELAGVPFEIAVPSALNACYASPELSMCGDGVIVTLTIIGVTMVAGWGSVGRMIFAVILALLPTGLYFTLSPIVLPLLLLFLLPLALDLGVRLLVPAQP